MSSEWRSVFLSDIATYSQGIQVATEEQYLEHTDNSGRFVRIIDYTNEMEPVRYIKNVSDRYFVTSEDIVMIRYGSQTAGKVVRGISGYIANNLFKVNLKYSDVDNGFLYRVLKSEHVFNYLRSSQSSSTMPAITFGMMNRIQFSYPTLREQRLISAFFDNLDDRIALLRETNATLEAIAQALFKSWFVDFDPVHANAASGDQEQTPSLPAEIQALFPSRFVESPQGLIPEGWEVGTMQDLFVLQRGFDLPASKRTEGAYPLIAASGPNGTHNEAMVKGPGVVTGRSGVLGKVFFTLEDFWPLNTTLWIKEFKRATPCYALEVLKRLDTSSFNAGSAVPSLNRNHIHGLPYLLPPSELINHFDTTAMIIHRKMHDNNMQVKTLVNLRDALLPRLISGQLRLPESE